MLTEEDRKMAEAAVLNWWNTRFNLDYQELNHVFFQYCNDDEQRCCTGMVELFLGGIEHERLRQHDIRAEASVLEYKRQPIEQVGEKQGDIVVEPIGDVVTALSGNNRRYLSLEDAPKAYPNNDSFIEQVGEKHWRIKE